MKFFPDPDKKFSPFDKSLIDKIIAGVRESDPEIIFIKNRHDTDEPGSNYNQRIISLFKKGEEGFYIGFVKISEDSKENFAYLENMVWDYCDCTGYDDNDLNPVSPNEWVEKKAKKLVGIRIIVGSKGHELTSFAVASQEDHLDTYKKLNDHAVKKIPEIIKLLIWWLF